MQKPSDNWKRIRRAALERAQRSVIEPFEPLFTIYFAVCMFYFVGFLRFQFFDHAAAFTFIEAIQLVFVAIAGVLVPILTGSVVTIQVASRRLRKLTEGNS